MNHPADKLRTRITVMLGSSSADRTTLELLSLLVAETPAEILGLFLEDPELLALAELPVAREFCQLTHSERRLEAADIERQLRIQARAAEQALAGLAGASGFNWSFRTVRGSLAGLLADALHEMDLLLLSASRSIQPLPAKSALSRPVRRPVAVIFDGSEAAERALTVACRIASAGKQPLSILLAATGAGDPEALHARAAELAEPAGVEYRELSGAEPEALLAAAHAIRASTLVIGLSDLLPPAAIEILRSRLRCPAVLVR